MIGKLEFPFFFLGGGMIKKECRDELHFFLLLLAEMFLSAF
jgi:hypothetical protein